MIMKYHLEMKEQFAFSFDKAYSQMTQNIQDLSDQLIPKVTETLMHDPTMNVKDLKEASTHCFAR